MSAYDRMYLALANAKELSGLGDDKDAEIKALNDLIVAAETRRAELLGPPGDQGLNPDVRE